MGRLPCYLYFFELKGMDAGLNSRVQWRGLGFFINHQLRPGNDVKLHLLRKSVDSNRAHQRTTWTLISGFYT